MDPFDFEALAKNLLLEQLKVSPNAPAAAGTLVRKMSVAAVASAGASQSPRLSVVAACKGIMGGMMLLENDLPSTAVAVLEQMGSVAHETHQDPAECMTWAMEGMAQVCRLTPFAVQESVRAAIDEKFMGAGEVFGELLRTAGA